MIVARRLLLDRRRSLLWWSLAVAALVAVTVALWPSIRNETSFEDMVEDLPEAVRALIGAQEGVPFTSAPGYLHGRVFSTLLPVLLLVFGIGAGARVIGGAEEDGTIELVLAHPVTRRHVAVARGVTVALMVVGLVGVALVSLLAMAWPVDLLDGIALGRLLGACTAVGSLALLHAAVAFATGCLLGRRGGAQAVAGAVAVVGYVLQGLIAATDAARPLRFFSPWHWYLDRNLLVDPPTLQATLLPLVIAVLLGGAGIAAFARRDLRLP